MKEGMLSMFGKEIDLFINDTIGEKQDIEISFGA